MVIKLRANCVGSFAAKILTQSDSKSIALITNTFPNSFYARTSQGELLFATNRNLKSPITINLESASNLDQLVRPHEKVSTQANTLLIGTGACIDLSWAASYDPRDTVQGEIKTRSGQINEALRDAALVLGVINTDQSILDQQGMAHEAAAEFARSASLSLRASDGGTQLRETAEGLVGLGSGFTPSGDDMLGGFLAMYNAFTESIGRSPVLLDPTILQRKTSWVSAKLLDYMQRLIVDEQVSHIINSVTASNGDDFVLALETLLPRGHTSGLDISVGAVLALSLIQDMTLGEKETEHLMREMGFGS